MYLGRPKYTKYTVVQRNPSEREVANPSAPARNLKDLLGEEESRNGEKNHM